MFLSEIFHILIIFQIAQAEKPAPSSDFESATFALLDDALNVVNTLVCPFPADNFSKYRKNIIPNKQCIILTHNL